jgi:6,7-dimethyl-8-ribityllumazine synthase
MLRKNPESKAETGSGSGTFAIVASRYHARYADAMLRAAKAELWRAEVSRIQIVRVPGAYEIPLMAKRLARTLPDLAAILCLGVVIRGETAHAEHIGNAVSRALMEIQLAYEIPIIHEVLVLENEEQAYVRCLDPEHNRGTEAAQTALAMVHVLKSLRS